MPTGSLDHETMSIASMSEMYFKFYSHSEFLQNVPIPISVWYWTNSQLSSKFVFLYTSKFSVEIGPRWLAAFIDEGMNNPHTNALVFITSIANVEWPVVIPNFFCKCWKTYVKQFVHESTLSSGYQNTRCPFWNIWRRNFEFKSIFGPMIFLTIRTSRTGPMIVLPGIAAKTLDRGVTRESVYSLHNGMICPKPSSSSGLVFVGHTSGNLVHERCAFCSPLWIELFRTVIRSPECLPVVCFQTLILEKTPKSSLLVNSRSFYFFFGLVEDKILQWRRWRRIAARTGG